MIVRLSDKTIIRRFQVDAPVDIAAMAQALGCAVWEDRLPEGVSGKLFSDHVNGGSEGYSITVNTAESLVRKRFTVAHEIAHFLLHRERIGNGLTDDMWYRSGLSTKEEAEANRLAARLLMPDHLIDRYRHTQSLDFLTAKFGVSMQAMKIRLGMA